MSATVSRSNPQQSRRLYPSHLERFQQCRLRYHLQTAGPRPVDRSFSRPLAKGNIAHEVLKICGKEWQESVSMPADLRSLIAPRLSRVNYPSQTAWETDVAEVEGWVKYGLSYLDPYATILGVEQFLHRTYHPDDGSPPIPLGAVIDMLLLRTDSAGQKFIEIIDYKTGKHLDASLFAPVISRFVAKRLIKSQLPDESFAPVVFTELYLAQRHARTSEMTLERCLSDWEEVTRTLTAITTESAWAPTPSPLCEWCQFNGNGCEPMREEEDPGLW